MRRFVINEDGRPALPPIDLDDVLVILGSGVAAQLRLPAAVAAPAHVRIERGTWHALAVIAIDGVRREVGESGPLGAETVFALGSYRVRTSPLPTGSKASAPQRTESLARELVRSLLGADSAPTFVVEAGPQVGAQHQLPPPEVVVKIGRGDDADWIILDEELSRVHAEVRRGWDGIQIRDLGSKNGTRIEGEAIGGVFHDLHDGDRVELGDVILRFKDPAERHLRGEPSVAPTAPKEVVTVTTMPAAAEQSSLRSGRPSRSGRQPQHPSGRHEAIGSAARSRSNPILFWVFVAIAIAAIGGAVFILLS